MATVSAMTPINNPNRRLYLIGELFLHAMAWLYIFVAPLFFRHTNESFDLIRYINGIRLPICLGIAFYTNYLVLVPRYMLKRRYKEFICFNVVLICALVGLNELSHNLFRPPIAHEDGLGVRHIGDPHRGGHHLHHKDRPHPIFFVVSNLLLCASATGLAIVIRISGKWRESQLALQRAEQERAEMELSNLKSQINPHFLLNTLNNIYALTEFDPDGARFAIEELSKMLRYMLYENSTQRVDLNREANFIRCYIDLMRLRLSKDIEVTWDVQIPEDEYIEIAPLIFISLVENAFKHGVSLTYKSYVHISLKATSEAITFRSVNTNHPKTATDKAPGGIGLKQVEGRLELSYPNSYTWHYGVNDNNEYVSEIVIRKH